VAASAAAGAVALALVVLMLGASPASAASPTVTSVSPASGPAAGGTAVKVKGTGFIAGSTVTIGSAASEVNIVSAEEITAETPAGSGTPEVIVTNTGGSSSGGIKYTYVAPPTVESITPNQGPSSGGTAVKIKGKGFIAGSTVTIGSAASEVNVVSAEEITGKTPAGSGAPEVIVTDTGGSSTLGPTYAYFPAPTVVTGAASSVTQSSATLNATVNPNGGAVGECKLEYGTTLPSASSAPCAPAPGSGTTEVAVSASVTGLLADTTYRFRIVAANGGPGKGMERTFTTLPNPPTVETAAASSLAQTAATLNAQVNPNGGAVSDCKFEYGTTSAYGSSATCSSLPGSSSSPIAVLATINGLTANTIYHFRILATNSGGASAGTDQTFTTPPNISTITVTITPTPGPTPIVVYVTPPNSTFKTLGASFNPASHMITFTESVAEPGTFRWLLTFQNGKFGVFGAIVAKCKRGFVKLGGKCRPSKIVFARGSSSVTSAGTVTFMLKPTTSALRALKNAYRQRKSLPVAMTLTFQSVRSTSPASRLLALTVRTR
jgi:IPT/TIG domain